MKKRYTEEQTIGFLQEADAGVSVKDLCRRHGFSEASYYLWQSGMTNQWLERQGLVSVRERWIPFHYA